MKNSTKKRNKKYNPSKNEKAMLSLEKALNIYKEENMDMKGKLRLIADNTKATAKQATTAARAGAGRLAATAKSLWKKHDLKAAGIIGYAGLITALTPGAPAAAAAGLIAASTGYAIARMGIWIYQNPQEAKETLRLIPQALKETGQRMARNLRALLPSMPALA